MAQRHLFLRISVLLMAVMMVLPVGFAVRVEAAAGPKQMVYDNAGLLSDQEVAQLEELANRYAAKRETDMIILTSANQENIDVVKLTEDFYDNQAFGYDKPHGNAVILTLDMKNRDVYLAGFYKAEQYLDDGRLDKIRNRITPDLSSGAYDLAFEDYIKTSYRYMGVRPGVNPDNLIFNTWFQLAVSIGLAGIVVGFMAANTGGRVTVNRATYENAASSGVLQRADQYIRTSTTKTKIPKNNGGGGGGFGGGGGISGGGHSHSGSRGKF
jgi:uncharacterized protein